jgi:hypothetical protein
MRIVYRTNLDVEGECWPSYIDHVPQVGSLIVSGTIRNGQQVRLKVIRVTYSLDCVEVELHLPDNFKSVAHFEAWYEYARGMISQEMFQQKTSDALDRCFYGAQWRASDDGTIVNGNGYVCKAVTKELAEIICKAVNKQAQLD